MRADFRVELQTMSSQTCCGPCLTCRIPHGAWNFSDYEAFLNKTCAEAGPGVSYTFFQRGMFATDTVANDSNVWWRAMEHVCNDMNWVCRFFLSGNADARHARNAGISAFGYDVGSSNHGAGADPPLGEPHQDNKGINERDFLSSIDGHMKVIRSLGTFMP